MAVKALQLRKYSECMRSQRKYQTTQDSMGGQSIVTATIQPEVIIGIEPVAARYLAASRSLEIEFNVGATYRWLVDSLEMRSYTSQGWVDAPRPTDEQLANVEIWPHKEVVEFVDI